MRSPDARKTELSVAPAEKPVRWERHSRSSLDDLGPSLLTGHTGSRSLVAGLPACLAPGTKRPVTEIPRERPWQEARRQLACRAHWVVRGDETIGERCGTVLQTCNDRDRDRDLPVRTAAGK